MLLQLLDVFANRIVPGIAKGVIDGSGVDALLLEWFRTEPPAVAPAKPKAVDLKPEIAAALAQLQNLTTGARDKVRSATTLNGAIAAMFNDKLLKAYLRAEADTPNMRSRVNHLIAVAPSLALDEPPVSDRSSATADLPFDPVRTLSHLKALKSDDLADFLLKAHEQVLAERARSMFADKDWVGLQSFTDYYAGRSKPRQKAMMIVARANIYANDLSKAVDIFTAMRRLFPADAEVLMYRAVAYSRAGDFNLAVADLRDAIAIDPKSNRLRRELGNVLRMASRKAVNDVERRVLASEAIEFLTEALAQDFTPGAAKTLARFLYDTGAFTRSVELTDRLLEAEPDDVEALVLKSRGLVSLNQVNEALEISERVLKLDPSNQNAQFMIRAMRFLAQGDGDQQGLLFGDILFKDGKLVGARAAGTPDFSAEKTQAGDSLLAQLRSLPFDWLRIAGEDDPVIEATAADELAAKADPRAGFESLTLAEDGPTLAFWRRDAVVGLMESGLIGDDLAALAQFERFYTPQRQPQLEAPRAIVMSRHGSFKFGGGEHFIESMAEHYQTVGYVPMIVGTRPEFQGQTGESNGFAFAFIEDSAASLRRLFLSEDARLVHAISGLGFSAAEALSYSNIPLIYGVHFWREVLGTSSDENFFDEEGAPLARPEFNYVLSRADTVYANSEFTRDVLEKAFGVRCPVIFSVPREGA